MAGAPDAAFAERVADTLQSVTKLRGTVAFADVRPAEGWTQANADRR